MFIARISVSKKNSRPQGKVSCGNHAPCRQWWLGQNLYYGQTDSRVALSLSCYRQHGLLFCVLSFDPCCQGSVRLPIVHKIVIRTPNFVDHTSSDCKAERLSLGSGKRARKVLRGFRNTLEILSETPLIYGWTTKLPFVTILEVLLSLDIGRGALRQESQLLINPKRIVIIPQDVNDVLPLSTFSCSCRRDVLGSVEETIKIRCLRKPGRCHGWRSADFLHFLAVFYFRSWMLKGNIFIFKHLIVFEIRPSPKNRSLRTRNPVKFKHAVNGRYKKRLNTYVIACFYILGAIRLALIVWPPKYKNTQ